MKPSEILKKIIDAVFLARPVVLIPVWGFCVFGYFSGLNRAGSFSVSAAWTRQFPVFCWIVVFSLSVGSVYVFNQILDVKVDEKNQGFPLLVKGKIPLGLAWCSACVLALASLCIPLLGRPLLSVFAAAGVLLGVLYCVKPMYFAGRFLLDFLTNATGYGFVSFGVGWHLAGAPLLSSRFIVCCVPYFFLMCAGSISSTLPDYKGDKLCGKNTTAVVLGVPRAHLLALCFLCAGLVFACASGNAVPMVCAGFGLPLYIAFSIYKTERTMEATYKVGGLISMLVAGTLFPVLLPASLITLAATVLYFRLRYRVIYPSLLPVSDEK
jgi:4-hydroxybenzoate polyprenyltransferase